MPTYEYICTECNEETEVFQSMNDSPLEACQKCNGKLRKVFSPGGVIFKGSGFYVNDYKKSGTGSNASNKSSNGNHKHGPGCGDSCKAS